MDHEVDDQFFGLGVDRPDRVRTEHRLLFGRESFPDLFDVEGLGVAHPRYPEDQFDVHVGVVGTVGARRRGEAVESGAAETEPDKVR